MRTKKTREDGSWEGYGLDTALRLNEVRYSSGRVVTFTLDSWGNRSSSFDSAQPTALRTLTYTVNAFNQTTRVASGASVLADFAFDSNGNTTTETASAGAGGGVTTYGWDKDNRLRSVTQPGPVLSTFEYDANGLRTRRVEAGVETGYLLDGASVLAELDGVGATKATFLNNPQAIDDVLAMNIGGQVVYPLSDALGSVYALTDSTGAIVRRQDFEVYGERTSSTGTGPATDRGYAFREHDLFGGANGRDRERLLRLGSWLQPDRLGLVDGPNLYQYARGNPAQLTDPFGLRALILYGWPGTLRTYYPHTSLLAHPAWTITGANRSSWETALAAALRPVVGYVEQPELFAIEHDADLVAVSERAERFQTIVYFGHADLKGPSIAPFRDPLQRVDSSGFTAVIERFSPSSVYVVACRAPGTNFDTQVEQKLRAHGVPANVVMPSLAVTVKVSTDSFPPYTVRSIDVSQW